MTDSTTDNTPTSPSEPPIPSGAATGDASYGAKDIQVLEGLEAVRKRPGMYIGSTGTTGLHHLVWEVVDNSVDEAMAGHAQLIEVDVLADGGVEVRDDGRGIPVDLHEKYEMSAAEVVLTVLHAGGKFGGEGYKVSGGLHGVGISVVNALSRRVEVEIDRDGRRHFMSFKDGGVPDVRLFEQGDAPLNDDGVARTGTTVRFWPDPTIFKEGTEFRTQTLLERFQIMAFLNAGLEFRVRDLRDPSSPIVDAPLRRRYPRLRPSPQRLQGGAVRRRRLVRRGRHRRGGRDRVQLEHRLPDRRHPQLRQRHLDHRGRDARAGLPHGADPDRQQLRTRQGLPQGKGREPPGRGHP